MKIYAQDGHQRSDKIITGLSTGLLDGAVFSARYLNPDNAVTLLENARDANTDADILIDPEFYASLALGWENSQLGKLEKWDYLRTFKRRELARTGTVEELLKSVYKRFAFLPVTSHIAPNIYISNSFDSIEASIALGFIERTKECFGDGVRPVYATLAIDRKALLNTGDFLAFLNDLTATEVPPDGFYILVGGGSVTERSDVVHSEIMDAEVLGAWMMLNYALTENGFKVINGFTDILTPFLVAAGATGCSTGWWTNLRVFSMGRYVKASGGGQLPIIRYLSRRLLNRVKIDEINLASIEPRILNDLKYDQDYLNYVNGQSDLPNRTVEILQSWETLASLNEDVSNGNTEESLDLLHKFVDQATSSYNTLSSSGISGGYDTNIEYLNQLRGGIEVFRKLAEL